MDADQKIQFEVESQADDNYANMANSWSISRSSYSNTIVNSPTLSHNVILSGSANTIDSVNDKWIFIDNKKVALAKEKNDIVINEFSLSKTIADIQAQLGIMIPDPLIEKEWIKLKELGDQYRALKEEILEKKRMWELLATKSNNLTKP